ncbi:ribosomal protein L18ae [Histomonas meleagridis]|uniref:ribosomal protein L18ae n=1 Tax=Histomonas meleagridis TaxID=135588 RepID=UPI003559CD8C|nr:ribosomal protein L18ae [Histomonas meleagridis]KAH0798775.1 ribosomal protein L18ae [Histomonas meleagridis]
MLKNYEVIARPLPTEAVPNPAAIRVQVFAADEVIAKSKFWGVARRIARLKKSHGEILAVKHVIEPEPERVKNYGIWLTYRSTNSINNIYKEFRDTTTEGAVLRLYQEMAGTHNVQSKNISIIRVSEIKDEDVVHHNLRMFLNNNVKFPILKKSIRPAHPSQKKILSSKRPTVCGF